MSLDKYPLISIIIPVKNGDAWLNKTLQAIFSQRLIADTEVIAIDSGSTDHTPDILQKFPVKILPILPQEFNHGATRNLGVQKARGKYVVMTVQDAEPENDQWLDCLLAGFSDEQVAGVCGQQIVPHDPDMNPVEWFRPIDPPGRTEYQFEESGQFDALSNIEKRNCCYWDNVNAMYRRDCLLAIPFRPTAYAEDMQWAIDALHAGYKLVYDTRARVHHYHHYSPKSAYERSFSSAYAVYKIFGIRPALSPTGLKSILQDARSIFRARGISLREKWNWLLYNEMLRKSSNAAVETFLNKLDHGNEMLDQYYQLVTSGRPQALKPVL